MLNNENGTISSSQWQPGTASMRSTFSLNSSNTLGKVKLHKIYIKNRI